MANLERLAAQQREELKEPPRPVYKHLVDYRKPEEFQRAFCTDCGMNNFRIEAEALDHARTGHRVGMTYVKRYYARGQ